MKNVNVITIATHNLGYFEIMKKSAKRHNIDIKILGWGQKYDGHIFKPRNMLKYLKSLPENNNDIIIFVDGFDSIFVDNLESIIKKFKKMNVPILVSEENRFFMFNIIASLRLLKNLSSCERNNKKYYINSGMYIGYRKPLINLLNDILKLSKILNVSQSDQMLMQKLCKKHKLVTDINNKIFYNIPRTSIKNLKLNMKNKKFFINNFTPSIISAPGNKDISEVLDFLKYENNVKDLNEQKNYFKNPLNNHINKVSLLYILSMVICIILLIKILYTSFSN